MPISRLIFAGALFTAGSLVAAPICPTTSNTTGTDPSGCSILITFAASGTPTVSMTNITQYDGSDDVTVGVLNNSASALHSVTLTSTGTGAFGFDGDGIQAYPSTNGVTLGTGGATGYESTDSVFDRTGVVGGDGTLVVNFNTPIAANGGFDYFSLEGTPSIGSGITVTPGGGGGGTATPEPASVATLATGLIGFGALALRRRRRA